MQQGKSTSARRDQAPREYSTNPKRATSKTYMRSPVAAEYLGFAISTLAKARVDGCGPPYIKAGRVVLYDRDDLDAWLATRKRVSTSDHGGA